MKARFPFCCPEEQELIKTWQTPCACTYNSLSGSGAGTEDGDLHLHEEWASEVPRTASRGKSLPGWRQWGKTMQCNHL